jgi:uncharacterized protein involved in exopolysaccharide biosynthesis
MGAGGAVESTHRVCRGVECIQSSRTDDAAESAEVRSSRNGSVLALRLRKRELLGRLNGLRSRLADVQRQLGVAGRACREQR